MGTRNLTLIRSKGVLKVAQYFQYDGYPTGQGAAIAEFLQSPDFHLGMLKTHVDSLSWTSTPTYKPRTNMALLEGLHNGGFISTENSEDFLKDSLFCEWAYELDLDKEVVKVYEGWQVTGKDESGDTTYGPCKVIKEIPFKDFTVALMDTIEDEREAS